MPFVLVLLVISCNNSKEPDTNDAKTGAGDISSQELSIIPDVALLPPIGDSIELTGDFDDSVAVTIEIFDLVNNQADGAPIGPTLSTVDGSISVSYDPSIEEQYHGNWDITDSNKEDGASVRVELRLGNAIADSPACNAGADVNKGCMAYFDVQLWKNQGQVKKDDGDQDTLVDLINGQSLPIKFHIKEGAANVPPSVVVTSPEDGSTFTLDEDITLVATANDLEDGDLSSQISWSSDIAGNLGTGAALTTLLDVGEHVITASVTDSNGDATQQTLQVIVTPSGSISGSTYQAQVSTGFTDLDLSPSANVDYDLSTSDPTWNPTNTTFEVNVTLDNTSGEEQTGVRGVFKDFDPDNVIVVNPDGYTAEGYPFIEYGTLGVSGTASQTWTFYAPDGEPFSFDAIVINADTNFAMTSVSPTSFKNDRVSAMTVQGEGFRAETVFFIQSTQLIVQSWEETQATLILPEGFSPATYGIMAVNPDGSRATLYPAITITEGSPPPKLSPKSHPKSFVTGFVYDYNTNQPLGGATVSIPGLAVQTTATGHFLMRGVPQGSHAFKIEKSGYETVYSFADVLGDQQTVTLRYVALERKDYRVTMIGPEGGTHNALNGAFLEIPEGALSETVPIQFTHTRSAETIPELPEDGYYLAFAKLGPTGLVFDKPATLFLPLQDGIVLPEGTPIRISYFDERLKRWVQDITSGVIANIDGQLYLEYEINHFTWIGGNSPPPDVVTGCVVFANGQPAVGISTYVGRLTDASGGYTATLTPSDVGRTITDAVVGPYGEGDSVSVFYDGNGSVSFPRCLVIPTPDPMVTDLETKQLDNPCDESEITPFSLTPQVTQSSSTLVIAEDFYGTQMQIPNLAGLLIDPSTLKLTMDGLDVTNQVTFTYPLPDAPDTLGIDFEPDSPFAPNLNFEIKLEGNTMNGEPFEKVETIALIHDLEVPEVSFAVIDDADAEPDHTYPFWGVVSPAGEPLELVTFLRSDVEDGSVTFPLYVTAVDTEGEIMSYSSPDGQTLTFILDETIGSAVPTAIVDGRVEIPVTINVPDPNNLQDFTFESSISVISPTTSNLTPSGQLRPANTGDKTTLKCTTPDVDPNERFQLAKPRGNADSGYCVVFKPQNGIYNTSWYVDNLSSNYKRLFNFGGDRDLIVKDPIDNIIIGDITIDFDGNDVGKLKVRFGTNETDYGSPNAATDGQIGIYSEVILDNNLFLVAIDVVNAIQGIFGLPPLANTVAAKYAVATSASLSTEKSSLIFRPVAGKHFLTPDSTISFTFTKCEHYFDEDDQHSPDSGTLGDGIQFCVEAKGNYAALTDEFTFFIGLGHHLEDLVWHDLVRKVKDEYGIP